MAATIEITITSPSGTTHQKKVVIGGKAYRMTTATRLIRPAPKKLNILAMPKLGTDLAH